MITLLLFIFIIFIKTEEELDLKTYEKLNTFEMISENENFIIKVTEPSIAYFDSFDKNSITYISKNKTEFINQIDEKITGKFYPIEPDVEYYVRNILYFSNFTSTYKKYLYPLDISKNEIKINDDINFLYFEENKTYTLNFEENTIKKMIKLSRKTLNSSITITKKNGENGEVEEVQLNEYVLYYKLEEGFKDKLYLTIEEDKAFIEFLSNEGEYETLEEESKTDYEIQKNTTIIKIENTQEDFLIELESDNPFNYSFSYGFSNENNYYYYYPSSKSISSKKDENYLVEFKLFTPFKNINLLNNEFFSFSVNIDKDSEQKIKLSYKKYSKITPLLKESLKKEDCYNIISNLKDVFELYVFTDIAKNPPEIPGHPNYHHPKINIQEKLMNISTENRYFYEFYQELMKILTATKDLHLNIYSYKTPQGILFEQYAAALPFNFIIKKDEDNNYKIFIKKNNYFDKFEKSVQIFINNHLNVPIKTINDIDPFDYIQNWSKFKATKNTHSQFTFIIGVMISKFYLKDFPFNYSDLNLNEYEFEDNTILRIPHYIEVPNLNDIEFNNFFSNYLKGLKDEADYKDIPFIDVIREKFLISKGLKKQFKQEKKEDLEWKFSIFNSSEKFLKCRVDEEKKVNVFVQTSFSFDYTIGIVTVVKCAKLFHENDYPIIIIESLNSGGSALIYMVMHQLFQIRTVDRSYFSIRMTDITKDFFKNERWDRKDPKTCKNVNSYNDLKEKTDFYNYNGFKIEHKRSEEIDVLPYYFRNILRDFREEYKDNKHLKKPTDIIIFTDSLSFSATSGLIKGFQNTGGAIIVGYYGNPKKEGIDLFDGSQSISSVKGLEGFYLYNNLYKLGVKVQSVTVGESFDDSVHKDNLFPREYAFDPVDYRVNIYSSYSDDIYQDFIKEGLDIHSKFNSAYCNSKNEKLLLHDDESCYDFENPHAHGGFKCKSEGNEWDKNVCEPYYCDIGFYYDQSLKECVEECNFNDSKSYLIYDVIDKQIYNIETNLSYTFVIENEKKNYTYFYIASEDIVENFPKIGFIESETLFVNRKKKSTNNCTFEINGISSDIEFISIKEDKYSQNKILLFNSKKIIILPNSKDHIFYLNNIFNNKANKFKIAKYEKGMRFEDILNISSKYYSDFNNIATLPKEEINIIYMDFNIKGPIHYYINPKNLQETIEIIDKDIDFLYLVKDKNYTLDFQKNKINRMIKLSRKTLNSEINIINENIKLNSDNLYYKIEDNFHGTIQINVAGNDALIEFLFKQDDTNILDFENLETTSNKTYNLIKFSKKYISKEITLALKSDSILNFNIFFGYSIPPYSYYYSDPKGNTNKILSSDNTFNLTLIVPNLENDKLINDEYFCVMIESPGRNIDFKGIYQDNDNKKDDKSENKTSSLQNWQIALIIISSVIVILLIVILIIFCFRKLKSQKVTNKDIEEKMEGLNEIKEIKEV